MPPLDHATLQAVLDKQGMPNTTENLNRIAQFAAVAPDMLDKYLGRGTDQSRVDSNVDSAVDRSIASTGGGAADPRLAQLAGPNPYKATLDPNTGLSNIGPGLVNTPEPRAGGGGGAPNAGRRGVAPPTEPPPGSIPPQGAPPSDNDTPWWQNLLPSLLAVGYRGRGNTGAPGEPWVPKPGEPVPEAEYGGRMPRTAPQEQLPGPGGRPQLPPPQQALPDRTGGMPNTQQTPGMPPQITDEIHGNRQPNYPSGAPPINKEHIYDATRPGVQAQIDAENAAEAERQGRARMQEEMRTRAQANTRELLRSGRNVFRK